MVRPADVIANRLGCPASKEDRARVGDLGGQGFGVGGHDLQMFGGDAVGKACRLIHIPDDDHSTIVGPAFSRNRAAFQRLQPRLHRAGHGIGQTGVGGDQDALRAFIMFCL